jgi:hypothetical protein
MAHYTTQEERTMSKTIDIPKAWWNNFTDELICDDATDPNTEDECLRQVWLILNAPAIKELKHGRRVEATPEMLEALHDQAKWYAYYWGDALADSAWDSDERLGWIAKGRSSAALQRKVKAMMAEIGEEA